MSTKRNLFKLKGNVQHYQWGGMDFIPDLLNIGNQERKPFAEYWLGAHNNFPSMMEEAPVTLLNEFIDKDPSVLGEQVKNEYGKLPYLLKVLDVKDMLSIQVHPSKKAAVTEFEKENQAGIPLSAPQRNYKDDNHKPELMLALSDFWLLHGFKPEVDLKNTLSSIPEFAFMLPIFEEGSYKKLYETLMKLPQEEVNRILGPLLERIVPLYEAGKLKKNDPGFWAARASLTFNQPGIIDRGIFSIYIFNLVFLHKDQAIFQDAGILHAYLEGQNMEIMANSDNVLRGGLTPKHIDVEELIKHVSFQPTHPHVILGTYISPFEEIYRSPAPDFQLSKLHITHDKQFSIVSQTASLFFVLNGSVALRENREKEIHLNKGDAAISFAGTRVNLHATADTVAFLASVPAAESEEVV
ncbi:MAG: mannose-6-phosphate isomerase, class I [Chitinophagaceae bacterium]